MYRKLLALCLTFLLVTISIPTSFAENATLYNDIALIGNKLYVSRFTGNREELMVMADSLNSFEKVMDNFRGIPIASGNQRHLVLIGTTVYDFSQKRLVAVCELADIELANNSVIVRAVVAGECLWLLLRDDMGWYTLYNFDLADGSLISIPDKSIFDICPGDGDEVFAIRRSDIISFANTINNGQVLSTVSSNNYGGLAYDIASGDIYWIEESRIMCFRNQRTQTVCVVPYMAVDVEQAYFCDGHYVARLANGQLRIQDVSSVDDERQTTLTIHGVYNVMTGGIDGQYSTDRGILIDRHQYGHYCAEEAYRAILNKSDTDIFLLPMSSAVRTMMERGYAVAMEDWPALVEDANQLYPSLTETLLYNDRVYAMMPYAEICGWQMQSSFVDSISIPKTWDDVLDLLEIWGDHPDNSGIPLLYDDVYSKGWSGYDYADAILTTYIITKIENGEELSFVDNHLMSLLERVRQLVECGILSMERTGFASTGVFIAPVPTAGAVNGIQLAYTDTQQFVLMPVPSIAEGEDRYVPVIGYVYIVNPNSKNIEVAMDYLCYISEKRPIAFSCLIQSNTVSEYRTSVLEKAQALEDTREALEARLLCSTEDEAEYILEGINEIEQQVAVLSQNPLNWTIQPNSLEQYQTEIAPRLLTMSSKFLDTTISSDTSVYEDLLEITHQYIAGVMSFERCIERMNQLTMNVLLEK